MIDRFVFITDTHLANKQPANRSGDYNADIFKKIKFVLDYCEENNIKNLIHGGDLFHSYNVRNRIAIQFVDLVKSYDVRIFYCYGNHDVQGGNHNFAEDTPLGFIKRYDWLYLLNGETYEKPFFHNIALGGMDCSYEVPEMDDYSYDFADPDTKKLKILVVHGNIDDRDKPMVVKLEQKTSCVKDVVSNADMLLCGHYHYGWKKTVVTRTLEHRLILVNPGSMARVKVDEARNSHGPRLFDCTVNRQLKIKAKYVDIPRSSRFDLKSQSEAKSDNRDKQYFIDRLVELGKGNAIRDDFKKAVNNILDNPPVEIQEYISEEVVKYAKLKLEEECVE